MPDIALYLAHSFRGFRTISRSGLTRANLRPVRRAHDRRGHPHPDRRHKAHRPADRWRPWPSHFVHFRIPRRTGVGYFNPRSASFGLRYSLTAGPAGRTGHLGFRGVIPLVGDWKGTGKDGIGYYDPATGTFYLRQSQKYGPADYTFTFGRPHMVPLAGDWDGNGKDGVGYYNPWSGTFHLRDRARMGTASVVVKFGPRHMVPIAGDWFSV